MSFEIMKKNGFNLNTNLLFILYSPHRTFKILGEVG